MAPDEQADLRRVLATNGKLEPYYRRPEKKARGKVLCVGSCEKTWPALTVPAGTKVAPAVPGVKGAFGTTKRPDNQDGWFASSSNVPARAGTNHRHGG